MKKNYKTIINPFLILFTLICFSSCVPTIFSAVTATTVASAKDRSFGDTVDDFKISNSIRKEFISKGFRHLYAKINFEVIQGRVLLTGILDSNEDVKKAIEIVWNISDVREVINELKINDKAADFDTAQYAHDSWITLRIKKDLFFNRSVKFVNYTIVTENSEVFVFGIARSEEELTKVLDIASRVAGVKKVTSHVKLKEEKEKKLIDNTIPSSPNNFE